MRSELVQNFYNGSEYLARLRARMILLRDFEKDHYLRAEKILSTYSVDPIKFIEDFCFLKFTEIGGETKPFFLFPYQKNIITKIQEYEMCGEDIDLLVDKPRGMGLTWLVSAYFTWRFLFTPNYSAFILSRTESEVDDGSNLPDGTIFGKMRWQMKMIPAWLLPEGFEPKKARGTTTDMTLKLINPQTMGSITGSSTNSNAGRSKRYQTTFLDECFFIDKFSEVYRSLTSVSRLKIFVSTTVESKAAKDFKDMCEQRGTYIPLTWKDHPWKDQRWYDDLQKKAEQLDDPDLMREAEVNYSVSPKSQYYPMISEAECSPVQYDRDRPIYMSLDIGGKQDLTVLGWWQFNGEKFILLDAYENTNKPAEWYAPFMNPEAGEPKPEWYSEGQRKFIQAKRAWKKPVAYFGELDHTIKRMPTNTSSADVLAPYGIRIRYNQYAIQHLPRHDATSKMLPKTIFNSESDAAMKVYDAIANSKYAGMLRTTSENLKPIHGNDGTADRRAMVENFAVNIGRIFRSQREDVQSDNMRSFARGIITRLKV